MATSPGISWSVCVKPLLSASYSSFNKSNLPQFCNAIIASEADILRHDDKHEPFYSSFVALAAHYLSTGAGDVAKPNLSTVSSACKVLLNFLLLRMNQQSDTCTISAKYLMILIKGLCTGQSCLPKADVVTFTAMLKSSHSPATVRDVETDSDDTIEPVEVKRTRLDTETNIFDQLTSVFEEIVPQTPPLLKTDTQTDSVTTEGDVSTATSDEMKMLFGKRNLASLIQLNGGAILIDSCLELTFLNRYVQRYKDALTGGGVIMPNTLSDALTARNCFQLLLNEVSIVWRMFSLPILEPLSPARLEKVVTITMGCLYAAVSVATTNTIMMLASATPTKSTTSSGKEEDIESYAVSIVQKALEVLDSVSNSIQNSARAGGKVAQNLNLMASWLLLRGLQGVLTLTPAMILERKDSKSRTGSTDSQSSKTKDQQPSSRPGSGKSLFQGLGVLSVALGQKAIQLLHCLFDELQIEGGMPNEMSLPTQSQLDTESHLNIDVHVSEPAWKLVQKLMSIINIPELMFTLVPAAFKKASFLKRLKQGSETSETSSSSASDSNTFYEDDFSSSEDSSEEEEEETESYLGQWMEDIMSPTEPKEPAAPPPLPPRYEGENGSKRSRKISSSDSPSLIPDKREPDGFISLAAGILQFMNQYYVSTSDSILRNTLRLYLTEEHMGNLAVVIRDMDKEYAKVCSDKVFDELSISLSRFNHSLVATSCLNETLQDLLLGQLGVSPNSVDAWPLTVYPRTLAVLAEVLLLRQQREREARQMKSQSEAAVVNIWIRFMQALTNSVLETDTTKQENIEHVNVEHLQLLLFLFHSLPLMQKKSLLLQLAQNIIKVANIDQKVLMETVPTSLCRLTLLLDYLVRNFYDPPADLLDQVQWNLFTVHTLNQVPEQDLSPKLSIWFPCQELDDSVLKNLTAQELTEIGNVRPRFYNLGPTNINNQEAPKVDGLACSFLLSNVEQLDYGSLYDACITLLLAGTNCDKVREKQSLLDLCVVQYNYTIVWRLLGCLPPSIQYLQALEAGTLQMSNAHLLHTLRWAPRLGHKTFSDWMKDCLVKQGLTTQKAEALLTDANKSANNVHFDVRLAMNFIQDQIAMLPLTSSKDVLPVPDLPGLSAILLLDSIVAKVQVSLDDTFSKAMSEVDPHKAMDIAQDLIPATLMLVQAYSVYVRSCILVQLSVMDKDIVEPQQLRAIATVMSIASSRASKVCVLGQGIMGSLSGPIKSVMDAWASSSATEFPSIGGWRNAFASDLLPAESYIAAIQHAHISKLSDSRFSINASMKHVLHALCRLSTDLVTWCPDNSMSKEMVRVMFPMVFDVTTEYIADMISLSLERFLGPSDGQEFMEKMYLHVLSVCHELIVNYSNKESNLDEKIFLDCLRFMENHLEKPMGRSAFEKFYSETADLTSLLLTLARDHLTPQFSARILQFFNRLLHLADRQKEEKSYTVLCSHLSNLTTLEPCILQNLLAKLILNTKEEDEEKFHENRQLLHTFTMYLVKDNSPVGEGVSQAILSALIPLGETLLSSANSETSGFPELMIVMRTLASAGHSRGHAILFKAATEWLEICKKYVSQKDVLEKIILKGKTSKTLLDTLCCLLSYVAEVLTALKKNSEKGLVSSPTTELDMTFTMEADSDWGEDLAQEEEETDGEDSDEESMNNKLCTFTITQKEFMNQHWYHCHTCKMVDGVGVCTVCARVCHKDHDLTYAKFGSFFCDCGAKEDGTCKALVKRTVQSGIDSGEQSAPSPFSMENTLPSSLRRRLSAPQHVERSQQRTTEQVNKDRELLCRLLEGYRDELIAHVEDSGMVPRVLGMLEFILPALTENYINTSPIGSLQRAQSALEELHTQQKTTETTDQLMAVTLGSQEGAFENVRMSYSGDQGQQIRQLITAHMLRRVAMCVLASPHGKRQHLAVSHEKGKITILQLSALLKQADSSKKKLTLTRLASAPIPFTVLSITGNPCNEDFLAVCGLKDCHVLTFTSSGSVADHLVLHPTLATGNFIIKALWLPGTQTELAIVTADFVKIYDLAIDNISPQYYFLLPSGKIRDATFVFTEEGRYVILMSSSGYIYKELMEETSRAKHGTFYITNVLEVEDKELKDVNGQVAGGGVSVYFSHALQLLFFSYGQGKSYCAPLNKDLSSTSALFPINFKTSNGGSKGGSSGQPLVQWSEVAGHTGLLYCMTQTANNPVVLMVKPDMILVQEIKVVPAKAKIQDLVAIRHTASNSDQQRTTMILLCEDGSLRIYMANVDNTNFWLSPYLQPQSPIAVLKPVKKKKTSKTGRPTGSVSFPIDFFEHCQQSNDIDFGGKDVLQIYNVQQLKHRLNTTGMYIASTKPAGFNIDVNNTNATTVMVGVRVLIGSQSVERAPSYLEVFGRATQVNCSRARWVDLPFTREESLTADKKFTLFVGAGSDPAGVTMVDSIKAFTKTKETFGWPEETDEYQETNAAKPATSSAVAVPSTESEVVPSSTPVPLTSADKLLSSALEVLDGAFAASQIDDRDQSRQRALEIVTSLLTLPTPQGVQQYTKSLMASLFSTKQVYHSHKDQTQLSHVMKSLTGEEEVPAMDVEAFQRLVVTARSVAMARPGNLVKFAEKSVPTEEVLELTDLETERDEPIVSMGDLEPREKCHFVTHLMEAFWKLMAARPANSMLAPVCLPGLAHVDATVGALVEIIHAFTLCDQDNIQLASKLYRRLLVCQDTVVSFACKQAIIRCLRPRNRRKRVFIPSPPRCSSPGAADDDDDEEEDEEDDQDKGDKPGSTMMQSININEEQEGDIENEAEQFEIVESNEPMVLEPPEQGQHMVPIGELLQGGVNFPPMVHIPPDADDETMVELAIALSLQDQSGNAGLALQGLRLPGQVPNVASYEDGQLSDTTASAPGSDDEVGSNAATDGSTLRTSPAEQGGSGGSESAGSAEESISGDHNVSGRSSAYGDRERGGRSETSSVGMPSNSMPPENDTVDMESDRDTSAKLHNLRLILLEKMLQYLPEISSSGGVHSIPFMQVLLMLTSDLEEEDEKDRSALDNLLTILLKELDLSAKDLDGIACRNQTYEVKLVYLRLLSVLLSRTKAGTKPSTESSSFISNSTASALLSSGAISYCLTILKNLLPFWKNYNPAEEDTAPLPGQLLKQHPTSPPPDMSPFFLRQYVKGHANDVFEDYPQLLTEMVLRLPYQLKKISDSVSSVPTAVFDQSWYSTLCEYMMTQQTPFVKRQVRKLLLFICGSKDKYRQLRDLHAIGSHLEAVMEMCKKGGLDSVEVSPHSVILPYDSLLELIEHLKLCSEIASARPTNWQRYCQSNEGVVVFLVKASIMLDEGVAPTLLQLLQCALCGVKGSGSAKNAAGASSSPVKQIKDKDKDKDKDRNEDSDDGQKHDESLCVSLIQLLMKTLDTCMMTHFVRTFLLESNATAIRWQGHSLVYQIYKNSSLSQQESLMELMWGLWKELPLYGKKAAQFVDLLGYFVLKTPQTSEKKTKEYLEKAIAVLKEENQILANHPNAQIYNMLQGLVDFDGYYLESDPCLVCNNPEVPYTSLKLSNIKVDSKFTTTTQIVKLVGSYTISKISLRISDLKRTKMVRVMNIFYNNRTVQAVVELKNKPGLWHKARKMTLTAGQTDIKVEFPIPIVACNLMIEYAEFYDNLQATSETLQCPRCSASVPANPGVCGNCGENVFQCHKCRAINYDEKDPFLCNACGFCKYAKFDFTLTAKPCCAVDPIENEEDRKKAISTINTLLEKADRIYKQLQLHRPALENLMVQVAEHSLERPGEEGGLPGAAGVAVSGNSVNKAIQHLALKYCGESKSSFDELSKIIQKVLACRRELVEYDRQQREVVAATSSPVNSPRDPPNKSGLQSSKPKMEKASLKPSNCFGCASAAVEHCITLLRALVTNTNLRQILCSQGMIQELIDFNLRHGTLQVRTEVRSLLCLLTKDSRRGTEQMNQIIMMRIAAAVNGHFSNPDLGSSVRHEILLLANSVKQEDTCWELRVRCVMRLFLMGMRMKQPVIMESVTLPCLRILEHLVKPAHKTQDASVEATVSSVTGLTADLHVNSKQWLAGDPKFSYQNWKKGTPRYTVSSVTTKAEVEAQEKEKKRKEEEQRNVHVRYLMEKYARRWRQNMWKVPAVQLKLTQTTWLQQAMFSPSSQSARQTATRIIETIAQVPARKKEIIDMLTGCLNQVGKSGECASEYLALYEHLIIPVHWKHYLAIKGVLLKLGDLITKEVEKLQHLEETTLSSDLAQGFALRALTDLMAEFIQQKEIKQYYKTKLVGYVLNAYLSLRKLLVQRTKMIDETQDRMLELLEELTTGTESETREFMQVCVRTIMKYPLHDMVSPVFIFERLCSIVFPEENDIGEFFLILEKDAQQEDFLQGRMLGNPYSSNEAGLGPLMRDVKNKICQDCELVALLEDDTGMELLVNKKIISLDLPVKEVYKKVWAPEHGEGEPMQVIYRMRGLLGDATEDMVNSLESNSEEDIDKEEVFRMASVLSEGDGLKVMLDRLESIKDLVLGKPMMLVLLKLFQYAVNVKANRLELLKPNLNTVSIMLGALNLALWAEQEIGTQATKGQTITEQILQIMETILLEASAQPPDQYVEFSSLCGDKDQVMMLLERINSPFVRANPSVLQALMRLISFLAFGDEDKMMALINHFKPYLDFDKFDSEHSQDEKVHLDCFCSIASGIESNANGIRLKDLIVQLGIVKLAIDYILEHAPEVKTLLATDGDNWKEFLSKPSLSYVLRLLTGICERHAATQNEIGNHLIPILHKLEQVSSDKHIGTMAENLLDALKPNETVAAKIEDVRQQTKTEKKRLAMAVRKKQLGALGMTTNAKGQVTVKSPVLKQMEDIKEETGLTCCICREGYRYQPQKVLAIYTFTKRANLDNYENKQRKTVGYYTVSHFNVIHVDCHTAAVRHARGREEWESAALQNANTKCNGLLPLWGPQVQESAFATCLARHNTYLQECTGVRDPSYPFNIHDLKMLLLRFSEDKSFSDESGGGGKQSNIHLLPYIMHISLYVINTTRSGTREEKNLMNFLEMSKDKWIEHCFEVESPLYWAVMAAHLLSPDKWKQHRVKFLERILVLSHVRSTTAIGSKTVSDKTMKEYSVYKPYLLFFALVQGLYDTVFKKVSVTGENGWSKVLAEYIRNNDKTILEACDRFLSNFQEEVMPCESVGEFLDVLGFLGVEVAEPESFMTELLASLP